MVEIGLNPVTKPVMNPVIQKCNRLGSAAYFTRTQDELSVVCPEDVVPADVQSEKGWRCLRVAGAIDFTAIGVLASLVLPLAEKCISVFAISTFDTDYLLVKEKDWPATFTALKSAGHTITGDASPERTASPVAGRNT